jgi:predicted N-acyltransferase
MTFEVEVLDSITKVKREHWDGHFNDPSLSYDWLLSIERSRPFQIYPRHIIVTNESQIVALLPCFLQFEELYSTVEDRIFGRIKPFIRCMGVKLIPALLAYVPLMYKSALGIYEHINQKEVIKTVLTAMDRIARMEKANVYGFSYLPRTQSLLTQLLQEHCFFSSLVVPNTYIDIKWNDFDGYIGYLKMHHLHRPGEVRREIKKNRDAGVRIEKLNNFSDFAEIFATLFENTHFRHTQNKSPITKSFFHTLSSYCNGIAKAYCAFKGDSLRAYCIILEGNEVWHVVLSGQDYEVDEKDYSYFNVVFYEPVREAIAKNARRIYFGSANYGAKLRRGCLIEPLSMHLKSPKMGINKFLSGWSRITDMWYKRKYRYLFT